MVGFMLSIFTAVLTVMKGQGCLKSNNEKGLPPFRDYSGPGFSIVMNTDVIPQVHQAIISSYRLDCCGSITEWMVDVFSNSDDDKFRYFLDLQVWRPSMSVRESGCYSIVGRNTFTSMSQDSKIVVVRPPPPERIQFQPGDVLGFYVNSSGRPRDVIGVTLLEDFNTTGDRGYEMEEVWYTNVEQLVISNRNCPFAVGSRGQLNTFTRAAPVISVSIETVECSRDPVVSGTPITTPPISILTIPTNTSAARTNIGSLRILIGAAIAAVVLVAIIISSTAAIFGAALCVKLGSIAQTKTLPRMKKIEPNFKV